MRTRSLLASFLIAVTILSVNSVTVPAYSWTYQDSTPDDSWFEKFGPRADRLLIRLYSSEEREWYGLAAGEVDVTSWPLSKEYYNLFTSNTVNPNTGQPYNETINVANYGATPGLHILDINNNNNEYLGNPPDPAYANPVHPNPTSVKEMRQAIAYLVDRSQLDTIIGSEFYVPLYTVVPPCMGEYSHPDIKPGGTLENLTYPYSRVSAEASLDAGGFPVNSSAGWRFWDRNGDGIEQPDEYLELKFVIRTEDARRLAFADFLIGELNAVKVRIERLYPSWFWDPMLQKDFHLYVGGWSLGIDPTHLILWNWKYYWHPGFCYDYAGCNNDTYNEASERVLDASTQEEALANAHLAQQVFAEQILSVPLWSNTGSKAMSRYYTGGNTWTSITPDDGENQYRGEYWKGTVNTPAIGIDNPWSFLNMHPQGSRRGDGENMTIRWGLKVPEIKMLNPVYASWTYDWVVLEMIYDSLLVRKPYTPEEFIPWLAEDFEKGLYLHPLYGWCTKIRFKMRPDTTWHDGTPLTAADVFFTFAELQKILESRGLPNPWWWSNVQDILDFKILDPYNFEILYGDNTVWVLGSISNTPILPKHIWKPIAETGPIQDSAPDPNLIGSGPWRFKEYVENSHLLLVTNSPNSTVQTNLPDSTPVTSTKGYHRYHPFSIEVRVNGTTSAKIDYYAEAVKLDYTLCNLYLEGTTTLDILITYPNGSIYSETGVAISALGNWTHSWSGKIKGVKTTFIDVNITYPTEFQGSYSWSHIFYGTLITSGGWVPDYVPGLDICGSTLYDDTGLPDYPYKSQLPTPDIRCDIKDIAQAAISFGSYPGHRGVGIPRGSRWNMGIADINNDYRIDIKDIAMIAKQFGWRG